ncbi:MAG: ATP-binding cassette domain-containing protein [Ferrovum sp.]|jgi:ATP-binding cassette subfamily F protein uup|nr:ATP-binding cassette domain-containing protein [Ferrovum sp.]NDU87453.1 ATP-binding cassette domain-containing protein [Ferrovum sp.]NDU87454.1 ATP-binding cassette domain-containing protein [Ferrovum sp.]
MPLILLDAVSLAFGLDPLLDHIDFQIDPGERIGLIGRNGGGKSTLLRIVLGTLTPDEGKVWRQPGLRMGYVPQEPELDPESSIFDAVAQGLTECGLPVASYQVERQLSQMGLDPEGQVGQLSGGWKKRVALARALVGEPDLLILDEPTNHLDVAAIERLEGALRNFPGAVLFITHDRHFLDQVVTRVVELDRGKLSTFGASFADYLRRKAEQLASEALEQRRFDKLLSQEEVWIRKGVQARRTRNEGRVRRLEELRRERALRRDQIGSVRLAVDSGDRSGELIAELQEVTLRYDNQILVQGFSTRIQRGDKIGIMGPNGVGKTTLLRTLLGLHAPDEGIVRSGTRLNIAYFDQWREQLDSSATLVETISPGSDFIEIGGTRKHVISYLSDFLFPPERARAKVASLSGGERNRLLLARLFARPSNVLVLDEPTNDLDIETLELLESLLIEYPGTLFLVSHDRAFLDAVVTQVMVLEGQGVVTENAGGYSDWIRYLAQRKRARENKESPVSSSSETAKTNQLPSVKPRKAPVERLSYKEQKELETLPDTIARLENEEIELARQLADGSLYRHAPDEVKRLSQQQSELAHQLEQAFLRWEELQQKYDKTQ